MGVYKLLSIGKVSKMIGVSTTTLRKWDKSGQFKPDVVTSAGTRYYSEEQVNQYLHKKVVSPDVKRKIVGYCRVSSYKQKDDLERQIENISTYMIAKGYQFEIITDIGSGINYTKKGLLSLIDRIMIGDIEKVVILYKDRLIRFGYELIEHICSQFDTEIEVIDNTEKTEQEELVEDLVHIITVFSCKLQGKRVKKTKELIDAIKESGDND